MDFPGYITHENRSSSSYDTTSRASSSVTLGVLFAEDEEACGIFRLNSDFLAVFIICGSWPVFLSLSMTFLASLASTGLLFVCATTSGSGLIDFSKAFLFFSSFSYFFSRVSSSLVVDVGKLMNTMVVKIEPLGGLFDLKDGFDIVVETGA